METFVLLSAFGKVMKNCHIQSCFLQLNPLVPKHRKHCQKTFILTPLTTFKNSNRNQDSNLYSSQ